MVLFNYSTKELTAKVVYYGPGLCGKTTNLQFIYDNLPKDITKGKMLSLATKTDRTLFFDFLPLDLGTIRGMKTRIQLYTVPGQVFYNSTRKMVLKGADGVVFVADSQAKMMDANVESFANLEENLAEQGMKLEQMPLVLQFNKRDLPGLAPIEELNTALNKYNAPFYEAIAINGIGVHDTLKAATKLVLNSLTHKYRLDKEKGAPQAEAERAPGRPGRPAAAAAPVMAAAAPAQRHAGRTPASIPVAMAAEDESAETVLEVVDETGGEEMLELVEEPTAAPDPSATMRLSATMKPPTRPAAAAPTPPSMDELEVIPLQDAAPALKATGAVSPAGPDPNAPPDWLESGGDDFPSLQEPSAAAAPAAGSPQTLTLRASPGESPKLTVPLRIETDGRTFDYLLLIHLQLRNGR